MMISTKGRYALRVMIDLAENGGGKYLPLRDVAERQHISEKYLESIIVLLSRAGYLEGMRGKGGGYRLTREPGEYTVGSILRLTEGDLAPVACLSGPELKCERAATCRTLPMWRKFYNMTNEFFDGITLEELMWPEKSGDDYLI